MEKDKCPNIGGSLLPPSGRHSVFSPPTGNNFGPSGSTTLPPMGPVAYSNDIINRMPDNPPKHLGHRRAHSEILTLPDDNTFDSDLGVVGGFNGPSFSEETEEDLFSMYLNMDKFNSSSVQTSEDATPPKPQPQVRRQHSQSMDGSSSINPEMSSADVKKSISAAKLALVDPKRAKRIWSNRQSAARSKERKMKYIGELEKNVQAMQTEATSLSAELTHIQSDSSGLAAKNSELKLRLQNMEQQFHLQDALNEALDEEIEHLKAAVAQKLANGEPLMMTFPPPSFGSNQQQQEMNTLLTAQQFQQLQIQSQKQKHQFQQQEVKLMALKEHASDFNIHAPPKE